MPIVERSLDYSHVLLTLGQGSQKIGMGEGIAKISEEAAEVWRKADQFLLPELGFLFSKFVWQGKQGDFEMLPEEAQRQLMRTEYAQLAVIIDGLATVAALKELKSLGDPGIHVYSSVALITAAANAGSIDLETALQLGLERGRIFRQVIDSQPNKTSMFVLIGLPGEKVEGIREKHKLDYCLLNGGGQIVLGAEVINQSHYDVTHALADIENQGLGKNVVKPSFEAAFHCRFFDKAVEPWQKVVKDASIGRPINGRLYGGTTVSELLTAEDIRNELIVQVNHTENTAGVWEILAGGGIKLVTEINGGPQRFMGILKRMWRGNVQNFNHAPSGAQFGYRWSAA